MRFILWLCLWAVSSSAHALTEEAKLQASAFYARLVECHELSLGCLEEKGLVRATAPMVYSFVDGPPASAGERQTAIELAQTLGQPLVLCPHLPGLKGLPAVDAIVYTREGEPMANLQIKTYSGSSRFLTTNAKWSLSSAITDMRDHYSADFFAGLFGFARDDNGTLYAKLLTPDKSHRRLLLNGLLHLLGFRGDESRTAWVVLDFSGGAHKHVRVLPNHQGFRITEDSEFDTDIIDFGWLKSVALARDQRYLILLDDSYIAVGGEGHRIIRRCDKLLN